MIGGKLNLDGYNEELRIAFEHQGIQHYRFDPFFHNNNKNNFIEQQKRDLLKQELCIKNNVILIQFGCVKENNKWRELKYKEFEKKIRHKLRMKGINVPHNKKIEWTQFISTHHDQDLILKLLLNNGSLIISNIASKLKFNLKSTSKHLKALKALDLVILQTGSQNKKIWSINPNYSNFIKERTSKISIEFLNERSRLTKPIGTEILELLKKESNLTTSDIAEKLGYSKRTIEKYIKSLESSGSIKSKRATGHARSHPKLWSIK